jgi:hypothetical protein
MKVRIAALALVLAASPAGAQEDLGNTGNWLHRTCNSDAYMEWGLCFGYVVGVGQATNSQYYNEIGDCLADTTYGQWVDVVRKYLADNPAERHKDSLVLVQLALLNGFSCASQQGASQ